MIRDKIIDMVRLSVPAEVADQIYWENGCLCVPRTISADHVFSVLDKESGIFTFPTVLEYDEY